MALPSPWDSTVNTHVPDERHPVLVEGDEADEDEEVEVRLDRAVGQVHEGRRAVHEAGGDEEGGEAAVAAPGGRRRGTPAARPPRAPSARTPKPCAQPEGEQRRHVQPEHPAQQEVPPPERLVVERVAAREVVADERHGPGDRAGAPAIRPRGYVISVVSMCLPPGDHGPSPLDRPRRTALQSLAHERTFLADQRDVALRRGVKFDDTSRSTNADATVGPGRRLGRRRRRRASNYRLRAGADRLHRG